MTQENSIYLVGYSSFREALYEETISFVTANEETAKAYIEKFNRVVTNYNEHVNARFYSAYPNDKSRRGCINWRLLDSKAWYTKTKLK